MVSKAFFFEKKKKRKKSYKYYTIYRTDISIDS